LEELPSAPLLSFIAAEAGILIRFPAANLVPAPITT
jgi:hypothetical protein